MEVPAEYWWIVPIGTLISLVLIQIIGYFRGRGSNGSKSPKIEFGGAVLMDSDIALEAVEELRGIRAGIDTICALLKHDSDEAEIERRAKVLAKQYNTNQKDKQ